MTDKSKEISPENPGVFKPVCGSVVTLGVAAAATVTSIYSSEIAVGITAWVAAAVVGSSAMVAAFRQS